MHHAEQVDLEVRLPVGGIGVDERPDRHRLTTSIAGIVDEYVDTCRHERFGHRVEVGHVERGNVGRPAGKADLIDDRSGTR